MITSFVAGQIWTYNTRPGESDSRITIVRVDDDHEYGTIIHVYISDVAIPNPQAPQGKTTYIVHMPFLEESLEKCVNKIESETKNLPDYMDGYRIWRDEFDKGESGVFSYSVAEALDFVQASVA